ncbi:MAG: hypothetical protein H5U24_11145 [Thioclava marina]|nr:hypothetical protein [Thioclava marina]TNF16426.1 MAG: hypothetical protein EP320_02065 [Paracoccaceae bacterium]
MEKSCRMSRCGSVLTIYPTAVLFLSKRRHNIAISPCDPPYSTSDHARMPGGANLKELSIMNVCRVNLDLFVVIDDFRTAVKTKYKLCFSDGLPAQAKLAPMVLSGSTDPSQPENVFTSALRQELFGQRAVFDASNFSVDVKVRSGASRDLEVEVERRWRRALVSFLESYITKTQPKLSSERAQGWFTEPMLVPEAPRH